MNRRRPKIGLVLGSGAARGWSHIGVIRALQEENIAPDLVCGCSIGAFVGAAYAAGELGRLETWVSRLTWQDVLGLLDISWRSGLIKGERLMQFFRQEAPEREFKDLAMPFAAVATDLETGHEAWLREGNLARAVRASIAMPGLFTPVPHDSGFYVDGGLVNPVPVSLARALGANIVIAVDLGSDMIGRAFRREGLEPVSAEQSEAARNARLLTRLWFSRTDNGAAGQVSLPSLMSVMTSSINIMQVRIARSRLAGEPADVLITPRLAQLGLMDYHRAQEAIAEGRAAVRRMLPVLEHALGRERSK